jgi:broad specificity phosphatase PhoE
MCHLILVRHSQSRITPGVPASRWPLTEEGRRGCKPLASKLAKWNPDLIVTSTEAKAIETGRHVATALGIPFQTVPNLHEHKRSSVQFTDRATFLSHIQALFAQPDKCVFGDESATQALARFSRAVNAVLETHPDQTIAIVAHGTVIALFVARFTTRDPFFFWQRLGQPALIVLDLPQMTLDTVEETPWTVT